MKETYVYIWIENNTNNENFDEYIQIKYNEDGDSEPSQFMIDAGIEYYDEDGQEFVNHNNEMYINEAFEGHSYLNTFKDNLLSRLKELKIENIKSQYLIYDIEDSIKVTNKVKNNNLKYIGKFIYNKDHI